MRHILNIGVLVRCAVALTAVNAGAQETPPVVTGASFGDSVDVTVVNVEIYVRDREGNPVRGLTADDFRVEQDGEPKPISNFAAMGPQGPGEVIVSGLS